MKEAKVPIFSQLKMLEFINLIFDSDFKLSYYSFLQVLTKKLSTFLVIWKNQITRLKKL